MAIVNKMRPIHPGEILREECLIAMNLNAHALAMALRLMLEPIGHHSSDWHILIRSFDGVSV